jgi:hypothetical protein
VLSAVLSAATPLWAADGVQLSQRSTIGTTQQTSQIQIDTNRMRAEMTSGVAGRRVIIFDGGKQVIEILNVDRKTYSELTKAQVDQLGGAVQDMMSQMQSAMANMSPEQRAQMEGMMRGRGMGGPAAPAKREYRKIGTDRAGKWACDKYEGSANGQKVSEICTVDPSVLGLTAADVQTFRQFADFFKKLVPQGSMPELNDPGFTGVPIKSVSFGATQVTTEIVDATRQTFADSLFAVPSDFTKEDFPMMGGTGRRGR